MCEKYIQELEYLVNRAICQSNISNKLPDAYVGDFCYRVDVEHIFDISSSYKSLIDIANNLVNMLVLNGYNTNIRSFTFNDNAPSYRIDISDPNAGVSMRCGSIHVNTGLISGAPRVIANINNFIRGFAYTLDDISTTGNSRIYYLKSNIRIR